MTFFDFLSGFSWITILFLIIGFALIILEMFTPGFGVSGISGIIFLALSIIIRAQNSFLEAVWMTILVIVVIGILFAWFVRSASKGALSRSPIVLNDSIQANANSLFDKNLEDYIGKEGQTLSPLRPSGMAEIDGVRIPVLSEGEFIDSNQTITVIRVEGLSLTVEKSK